MNTCKCLRVTGVVIGLMFILLGPWLSSNAWAASGVSGSAAPPVVWNAQLTRDGGMLARAQWSDVVRTTYAFWGPSWQWQDVRLSTKSLTSDASTFLIQIVDSGIRIDGKTSARGDTVTVDYEITTTRSLTGFVGGGIEFYLTRPAGAADPELLPSKKGFRWPTGAGEELLASFSAPLADLYFEGGNRNHIRCMLIGPNTRIGKQKVRLTFRLPKGGLVEPSRDAAYGIANTTWQPDTVAWDGSAVDLSFLNAGDRPAGARGRIRAQGERLLDGQGREIRLWGTNLSGYMLFNGSQANICAQAKRLSALGFNLARLHHHDSDWVQPNVFGAKAKSTRKLNADSLAVLDHWVKCLNDEGIYVWLDLHVGRMFMPADNVTGSAEIKDANQARAFAFVNPQLERLMHEFAKQYLDRKNIVTGQRYADNAGVFAVQIVNESDLGHHFGAMLYPGAGNPLHEGLFEEAVAQSAARLKVGKVRGKDTWAPGAGKQVLADIETDFFRRGVANLRALGWKSLVAAAPTWGEAAWNLLPPLTRGDVIDVHAYGGEEELSRNPHVSAGVLTWVAGARVAGYPLAVSEWGLDGVLVRDRFTLPLHFAAVASLQGWNAVMHFAYQQTSVDAPDRRDRWASAVDPALLVTMPAAALMYRAGHVAPARRTVTVPIEMETLYGGNNFKGGNNSAAQSRAVRTLVEQSRIAMELPVGALPATNKRPSTPAKAAADRVTDLNKDYLGEQANEVVSDTGELKRDFGAGFHTVNTARTQAAAGWIGGRKISLSDVELQITTPKAAVAVSSLDGLALKDSRKVLISLVAQAEPGPQDMLPFRAEPVRGRACLTGKVRATARLLSPTGKAGPALPMVAEGPRQCLELPQRTSHFVLVERAQP